MRENPPFTLTQQLISLIRSKSVNPDDFRVAAEFTLDTVANMLAGFNSEAGHRFLSWAHPRRLLNTDGNGYHDAGRQAFILGCLTHILEMDDLHRGSITHPGCVVIPAVFALAVDPKTKTVSASHCLEAVLHGYEATARIGHAVGDQHYVIWHNTATCGPFGSAMAAAHMLGLDNMQTAHALGNAGTQAAGLWEFLKTGAMSKHIHAGRGAEAGVVAAELARHGITGALSILEGEKAFFKAMCADGNPSRILEHGDDVWHVHQTSIKPWPSCRHTHPAIKVALEAAQQLKLRGLSVDDIESAEVKTYQAALNLCDRSQPNSLYEAKFSLQHCVAAALVLPAVDFSSFNEKSRQRLKHLSNRIKLQKSDTYETAYPAAWGSGLNITLHGGHRVQVDTSEALGDPANPLSQTDLINKAEMLLKHAGLGSPARLIDEILSMADNGPVPILPLEECLEKNLTKNM